ncbi:MAG TPA: hypothetical protein DEP61_06910 [Lachnospiraceae bacterium]|nr:hypothetical protein [Lachnospiraceae bacterium]
MGQVPEFGIQVMAHCKREGITQHELADEMGVTRTYLNLVLNGKVGKTSGCDSLVKSIRNKFPDIKEPYECTSPDPIIAGGKEET